MEAPLTNSSLATVKNIVSIFNTELHKAWHLLAILLRLGRSIHPIKLASRYAKFQAPLFDPQFAALLDLHHRWLRSLLSRRAIAATFVCPLDVIKTRLQVHGLPEAHHSGPNVAFLDCNNAFVLSIFLKLECTENSVNNSGQLTFGANMIAASGAGAVTAIAANPLWVVKTRLQNSVVVINFVGECSPVGQTKHCTGATLVYFHEKVSLHVCVETLQSPTVPFIDETTYRKHPHIKFLYSIWSKLGNSIVTQGMRPGVVPYTGIFPALRRIAHEEGIRGMYRHGMRPGVVPYTGIFPALRRIAREEGIRGMYSGLLPSLAGISHVAIQFPAYEEIKSYLARRDNTTPNKVSPGKLAIASPVSEVVASVMTYPHEVVHSRLQEQGQLRNSKVKYAGVVECIKQILSPDDEHSEVNPKSDGHIKRQEENDRTGNNKDDTIVGKSHNPSNKRTAIVPFRSTDKLRAE
ncbi:hypothetical protein TEA_024415 [Camellia sinensis var. sinensis]|uniref:Uncharacterized protein n=1 Tax=Camellia sinensis var. sinensis TaxID=542762 RepID=A0A4S4D1H4_CAMSN|nr:hypothetical protein TEA_024415 [Camellia sinensis var. sinensis]